MWVDVMIMRLLWLFVAVCVDVDSFGDVAIGYLIMNPILKG